MSKNKSKKSPSKAVKSKKTSKKSQTEMLLELNGEINLVEKKKGKVVATHPIDGKVCLEALLSCITSGIRQMELDKGSDKCKVYTEYAKSEDDDFNSDDFDIDEDCADLE